MICTCPKNAHGPWDCMDCPEHGEDAATEVESQHKAEIDAENAWLRHAEMGSPEDWVTEQHEREAEAFWGLGEIDGGGY